jgi:hypothetical protein
MTKYIRQNDHTQGCIRDASSLCCSPNLAQKDLHIAYTLFLLKTFTFRACGARRSRARSM